jgi:hypothetical protein
MSRLDDTDAGLLVALSVLVARARSPVERDRQSRDIEAVPQGEGPGRFVRQLHKLTLCLYTLGLDQTQVHQAIRRVGLDSITPARRQALGLLLATESALKTSEVAARLALPTVTVRRVLEDLTAHGLLHHQKTSEQDNAPHQWWPTPVALDLWRQLSSPHEQGESRVSAKYPSHLYKRAESVEECFAEKQLGLPEDEDGAGPGRPAGGVGP